MKRSFQIPSLVLALTLASFLARPTHADEVAVAAGIGITPTSMVVAGATPTTAATVLVQLAAETELLAQLVQKDAAANAAAQELSELAKLVSAAPEPDVEAEYQAAIAALQAIHGEIEELREALFQVAAGVLAPEQVQRLQAWQSSTHRRVPAELRVASRTEEQWQAIELALRAEARALRLGVSVPSEHAEVLAAVRSEPAVIVAQTALAVQLDTMQPVFEQQ